MLLTFVHENTYSRLKTNTMYYNSNIIWNLRHSGILISILFPKWLGMESFRETKPSFGLLTAQSLTVTTLPLGCKKNLCKKKKKKANLNLLLLKLFYWFPTVHTTKVQTPPPGIQGLSKSRPLSHLQTTILDMLFSLPGIPSSFYASRA